MRFTLQIMLKHVHLKITTGDNLREFVWIISYDNFLSRNMLHQLNVFAVRFMLLTVI